LKYSTTKFDICSPGTTGWLLKNFQIARKPCKYWICGVFCFYGFVKNAKFLQILVRHSSKIFSKKTARIFLNPALGKGSEFEHAFSTWLLVTIFSPFKPFYERNLKFSFPRRKAEILSRMRCLLMRELLSMVNGLNGVFKEPGILLDGASRQDGLWATIKRIQAFVESEKMVR
jgi:hypothetical protein